MLYGVLCSGSIRCKSNRMLLCIYRPKIIDFFIQQSITFLTYGILFNMCNRWKAHNFHSVTLNLECFSDIKQKSMMCYMQLCLISNWRWINMTGIFHSIWRWEFSDVFNHVSKCGAVDRFLNIECRRILTI